MGSAAVKRYEGLELAEALSRPYDYPTACHELGLILRAAYAKLSKGLQSLVLRDTLDAFRRLPEVQTTNAISSANFLLQAAEVALPKQKRALVASEFKHAMVAHKRRCKAHQDGGSVHLPQDVLTHIFSFLDVRSLATVSSVCWAWNFSAGDDMLWQKQYYYLFGKDDALCEHKGLSHKPVKDNTEVLRQSTTADPSTNINWRETFKRKYMGNSSWRFTSNRALCKHCKSIIWLSHRTCARSHQCPKVKNGRLEIRPISPYKIVDYLLDEPSLAMSSSESDDSDSDGPSRLLKLWAYPRLKSLGDHSA